MKTFRILCREMIKSPKRVFRMAFIEYPLLKKSSLFDSQYYLRMNPDVVQAQIDPLWHYLVWGASEGRAASKEFITSMYLANNQDVKDSGMNPLVHYIRHGKAEGRSLFTNMLDENMTKQLIGMDPSGNVLILDHGGGGGTNRYVRSLVEDRENGNDSNRSAVIIARYEVTTDRIRITVIQKDNELLCLPFLADEDLFYACMEKMVLREIIVNSLVSWPSVRRTLDFVSGYKEKYPKTTVQYKGHDYFCICPSYTLLDDEGSFCGVRCDEIECGDCIRRSALGNVMPDKDSLDCFSITQWRKMWRTFFEVTVDSFDVFSESSKAIFLKAYPSVCKKLSLVPHKVDAFDCCHVAVLGTLSLHKGQSVIEDLCRYLYALSIDNLVIYLYGGGAGISSPDIQIRGSYRRSELPELLKKDNIDIVFIPSVCNETFCYTMAESLALGYLTACFDLGGQADLARASDHGIILDSRKPGYIYSTFMRVFKEKRATLLDRSEEIDKRSAVNTVILQDRTSNDFLKWMYLQRDDKRHFVPEAEDSIAMDDRMPRVIASYLPQFHDFPENICWFGRGFSEWTNTSQTLPQFLGHRQPNVPIDVGYYQLDDTSVMHRQAELAKKYGIAGFCVYYYWFSGKTVMDEPLKMILEDKTLDFPFFLFWANDDWTRSWGDGAFQEVLYHSEMNPKDADRFMADILPYMKDPRYIRIKNKPVLLIYKTQLFSKADYLRFVDLIQRIAKENGFEGIYLISPIEDYVDLNNIEGTIDEYRLDAMMEFHPIAGRRDWLTKNVRFADPNCRSTCYDVDDYVNNRKYLLDTNANVFAGLFPNWDNSPRRYSRGAWILQNTPENYKKWLLDLIQWTYTHHAEDERFIFVNAWNEWAESAYLEPDTYHGYAYLQMTREALEEGLRNFTNGDTRFY